MFKIYDREVRLILCDRTDFLQNFYSIKYSLKSLNSVTQALIAKNMMLNGNDRETLGTCTGKMRFFGIVY